MSDAELVQAIAEQTEDGTLTWKRIVESKMVTYQCQLNSNNLIKMYRNYFAYYGKYYVKLDFFDEKKNQIKYIKEDVSLEYDDVSESLKNLFQTVESACLGFNIKKEDPLHGDKRKN